MTVKNYVLDINKTSLQHPSIVLRQDDYNIYTVNISVTENGVPVNLGSYTLNFLGITPAGAKIIDSKNFITNDGDLKNGKFSYRFPKEAAGSKGVYDVAYFRLKTSSGATSTIDLNLRVLGGVDLTADDVKDYITVDDTLRNTLVAEVFKKVDAKVDRHLATVKKGDKGDKGDPGKDAEMPVIGGTNLIRSSEFDRYWSKPGQATTVDGYNGHKAIHVDITGWTGNSFVDVQQPIYNADVQLIKSGEWYTISFYAKGRGTISTHIYPTVIDAGAGSYTDGVFSSGYTPGDGRHDWALTDEYVRHSWSFKARTTLSPTTNHGNMLFRTMAGNSTYVSLPKLEKGNVATDWSPAPEDIDSAIAKAPKLNGNNMYVGDNTYMGTNTFMDGVSLNGKNVVNGITDTDWQSLSLNEGYEGSIKYRYHMGALYLGIDDLTGIQAGVDKAPGRIPNYTTSKYHRFPIIIAGKGVITGTVRADGTISVGNINGINLTDSDKGYATVTVL